MGQRNRRKEGILDPQGQIWHFRPVDLTTFQTMDPHLLVGLVNTELRNHCDSLDDLVLTHGLDQDSLLERLRQGDYAYQAEQNQFR